MFVLLLLILFSLLGFHIFLHHLVVILSLNHEALVDRLLRKLSDVRLVAVKFLFIRLELTSVSKTIVWLCKLEGSGH